MFLCSFDACLHARQSDGHPVLKAVDRVFFKQCVWRWLEKIVVFVEAFGFEGKHPLHLSLESVQFTVSLGLCCDPVQVFVALVPELDGVVHGDCNGLSTPGGCTLFCGCV